MVCENGRVFAEKGSLSAPHLQNSHVLQGSYRFANGCSADGQSFGEDSLGGEFFARPKLAGKYLFLYLVDDAFSNC